MWFPPVPRLETSQFIAQSNLRPTSRANKCLAARCKPSPLLWHGRCHLQVVFRSSVDKHHHLQASTAVDNAHPVLRLYDRCGQGCLRFFDVKSNPRRSLFCARLRRCFFYPVELFVEFPRFGTLSSLHPRTLHSVTTGVRFLAVSDLDVVC